MRNRILFNQAKWFQIKILMIAFSGLYASSLFSQPITWQGSGVDTFASNPASWSGGLLPTATSDIIIEDGAAPLFVDVTTTWTSVTFKAGSLPTRMTIGPNVTLTITGNTTIESASAPRGIIVLGGFFNCPTIAGAINTGPLPGNVIIMAGGGELNVPGDVTGCNLGILGTPIATFGGNFTGGQVYAPFNVVASTIEFNSADPQSIPPGIYGTIIFSGGGDKTLAGPVTVTSNALFVSGIVINSSSSPLFFDGTLGGLPTVSGVSALSFATGPVRWLRLAAGQFTFPVGKLGAGYHPVTINPVAPGSVDFTAEYIRSSGAALGTVTAPGILGVSNCEYWVIDRTAGAAANVTLEWNSNSGCNGAYITDPSTISVVHFNGTNWDESGGTGTGTAVNGSVEWTGVTNFSPFTLGTTSLLNPLPVGLTDFSASRCGNKICLFWNTVSENNNDHFEIERSADGRIFNSIGSVNGNGTTSIGHNYTFSDAHPLNGKNYYRLKQVDIDRKFSFSSVLRVNNLSVSPFSAFISPNPAGSVMNLVIEGIKEKEKLLLVVMNTSGMIVHRENLSAGGTTMVKSLPRPAISAGLYFYKITRSSNNETISGKVVLQ